MNDLARMRATERAMTSSRCKKLERALTFTVKELGLLTTHELPEDVAQAMVRVVDRANAALAAEKGGDRE